MGKGQFMPTPPHTHIRITVSPNIKITEKVERSRSWIFMRGGVTKFGHDQKGYRKNVRWLCADPSDMPPYADRYCDGFRGGVERSVGHTITPSSFHRVLG